MKVQNKSQKILEIMLELSGTESVPLNYEDIVVAAYKKYPEDFHLRGYPQYPDSADVSKPLYTSLKRKGYVLSGGKKFQLTELGSRVAKDFQGGLKSGIKRLPRDLDKEINRIKYSEGFKLFLEGRKDKIIDSDFYDYLGVTVSTSKSIFLGKLNLVETAIETLNDLSNDSIAQRLKEFHQLMITMFKKEIPKR